MIGNIRHFLGRLFVNDSAKPRIVVDDCEQLPGIVTSQQQYIAIQQQQYNRPQHELEQQLRGQLQMGAGTAATIEALIASRPNIPSFVKPEEKPAVETKAEVPASHEPELEEIVKEDGSIIIRLRK